jgi:heterodisulfide reductase subunit A-like polyferredoxin
VDSGNTNGGNMGRGQLRPIHARIRDTEHKPKSAFTELPVAFVDAERCIVCGICEDICPFQAISIDRVARVDQTRCSGCGQCAADCPQEAISFGKSS